MLLTVGKGAPYIGPDYIFRPSSRYPSPLSGDNGDNSGVAFDDLFLNQLCNVMFTVARGRCSSLVVGRNNATELRVEGGAPPLATPGTRGRAEKRIPVLWLEWSSLSWRVRF